MVSAEGASVRARLDTGDPWAVERPHGSGRVLVLATPLDAEGGTLPVNPDYVPLVKRSIELWKNLEEESLAKILHLTGGTRMPHRLTRVA